MVCIVITYSRVWIKRVRLPNPARGQLKRENDIPLSPCVPENLVSRDGFSRPVPRQPAHLHTQAESGAYLRDSSRVPRWRPFMKPPYAIGSVPSLYMAEYGSTGLGCESCTGSAGEGKLIFPFSTFAPENLVSRDGFGSPVPRQPAHLHT